MDTSIHDTPTMDRSSVAAAALDSTAWRMDLPPAQITRAFALSNWTSVEEMIEREFEGNYREYFPKCDMTHRDEAVIAEIFDMLAGTFDDPRRAMRCGVWTPPGGSTGGRSDG